MYYYYQNPNQYRGPLNLLVPFIGGALIGGIISPYFYKPTYYPPYNIPYQNPGYYPYTNYQYGYNSTIPYWLNLQFQQLLHQLQV